MIEHAVVYVVDDDHSFARALGRLLRSAGYEALVCPSVVDFLRVFDSNSERPACIVLDQHMPVLDGLQLQALLHLAARQRPIIFLSGVGTITMSVAALRAGAVNFLTKPFAQEELFEAVETALSIDTSDTCTRRERESIRARLRSLTPREREVMEHVARGRLNKQIATDLGTAEKTVKVHRGRVMHKMGVRSVPELVRLLEADAADFWGPRPGHAIIDSLTQTQSLAHSEPSSAPALPLVQWATWDWDIRDDRVFADPSLASLFGVSRSEAAGGPLDAYLEAIHPDDVARVSSLIRAAISQGSTYEARYRVRRRGNEVRTVIARGRAERDASGRPQRLPGFVLDISDWRP